MSQLLERFLSRAHSAHRAVVDDAGEHSYGDVVKMAIAVANALRLEEGERVAILVHPSAEFIAALFGVFLAGGTVLVLSPLHPAPESRYFCEDAGVRTILASAPERARADSFGLSGVRDLAPLFATLGEAPDPRRIADDAPALQLYTSGTTGKPKGAILTHRNMAVQQEKVGEAWGFVADDVLLHALPLHHMHGLAMALFTALGAAATIRFRPFDAPAIWEAMREASVFMGVPAMYHRLFVAFDAADDVTRARWTANAGQLRLATSGSAALPVSLAERWRAVTGEIPLERFGMTEIGVGITNALHGPRFAGCVGFPLDSVEVRIASEDGSDLGELWIRGPSVFAGYHDREEATKEAFADDPNGGPRWFRTGDMVTRDDALPGRPYKILGRTSVDILKSGGYKLSALEIEEALREHAAVLEVAVVGVPDDAWGDRVVACVIRRAGATATGDDLRAFARERLAPYKVPKEIRFMSELPKNALGKVVKPELKRMF